PGTTSVPEELARPIAGTVFIAGEATTLGAAGTVHGALESGERAARQVLESMGGQGSSPALVAGPARPGAARRRRAAHGRSSGR
ncbi:MAG TPA: FAD-dependent oxidoreductase, partial [Anaeromyxobacteraceae bacterium]